VPSKSFEVWRTIRANALDEIISAHQAVGGTGPGRRFATQQINHAYAMLLSSQFQGFCRDLHTECIWHLVRTVTPASLAGILDVEFNWGRKLDKGNPNPGNIGADFNRLGIQFWDEVVKLDPKNTARKAALELLNEWRNAIAHQDFDPVKLGGSSTLHFARVNSWRRSCHELANAFDEVMRQRLTRIVGTSPW
jgi:hypothetical protein